MHDLPLTALRAFAAIYETGGVRPAARRLEVAHSAVSRHLRELEGWLDAALVEPTTGAARLVFTAHGDALGRAALHHLSELDRAVTAVKERRRGNSVTISTTASLAARWLLPRLSRLNDVAPWVEVSVVVEQKLADPTDHGADLCLRMGRGPWPGLICEPWMDDSLYPVMSSGYWRAAGCPVEPGGLRGLRLLHDRDPQATWADWRACHDPEDLDVRSGPRFSSSDLVLRAAAEGLGVALARDRLVSHDLATGALLRPLGDAAVPVANAYWIVRSQTTSQRSAVDRVIEWLKTEATE